MIMTRLNLLALFTAIVLAGTQTTHATLYFWTGTAGNPDPTGNGNWAQTDGTASGIAPGSADEARFTTLSGPAVGATSSITVPAGGWTVNQLNYYRLEAGRLKGRS